MMQLSRNIPMLSELILVTLFAWIVSGWFLQDSEFQPVEKSQNVKNIATVLPDISGLLAVPVFGKREIRTPKPAAKKNIPVVQSRLNIKLLGTVVAGENSAAIVAIGKGSEQEVFLIGDRIQPGVVLKEITAASIVIERGGKLERILLEQGAKLTAASPPAMFASFSGAAKQIHSETTTPAAQTTNRVINRTHLQQQLQDFPALMSQAKAMPYWVDGKPGGFVISEIAPGSLYQQAGLQNGDIILRMNGEKITDAKQAMKMYQTLTNASSIDLKLIRSGQVRQIHYNIH